MKFLGWLMTAVLALGLFVLTAPRVTGLSMVTPIAQVVAFRGLVMVATAVVAAVALLVLVIRLVVRSRRPRPRRFGAGLAMNLVVVVLLVASLIGHGLVQWSRGMDPSARTTLEAMAAAPIGNDDFTVVSLNTEWDAVDPDWVAALATSAKARMIALPESERDHAEAVAAALEKRGQPGWQVFAASTPWPNAMLVSPEAGKYRLISDDSLDEHRGLVMAEPVGHDGPLLVTVHAMPPPSQYPWTEGHEFRSMWWKRTVASASTVIRNTPNIVAAGDFNATLDHAALDPGIRPASYGATAWGTWPSRWPSWTGARIDHVYAKPYDAHRGSWVIDVPNTDHRAVVVRLTHMR